MNSLTSSLLFITFISFISTCRAQDRAPHGLAYAGPMAFSPEAYDFFHPNTQGQSTKGPCSTPDCTNFPLAATIVQSTPAQESMSPPEGRRKHLGSRSLVGIPVGLVFALLVGLGAYFVVIQRRSNASRAKAAQLQSDV